MAWTSLTGACRWRAADPVSWRRSAARRACSVRSPTLTTRPPGTLQASTSRARPSPRLRRRETGPVASSPAATASSIADASSGGASRTSRSRASLRIRLARGGAARRRVRHGAERGAQRLDARLGRVLELRRPRRQGGDRLGQATGPAPPGDRDRRQAAGRGGLGGGGDGAAARGGAPRRRATRGRRRSARAPRPAPPAARGPRPPSPRRAPAAARSTIRPPEGSSRAASTAPSRSDHPPTPVVASADAHAASPAVQTEPGPPACSRTRPAGPSRRAGTPAPSSAARAAGMRVASIEAARSSAVRASGSPARAASRRMSRPTANAATRASTNARPTRTARAVRQGSRVRRSECMLGRASPRAGESPSRAPSDWPGGEIGGVDDMRKTDAR